VGRLRRVRLLITLTSYNFSVSNIATLEAHCVAIANSLRLAVRLLSAFGFTERTLTADSVIIPVACYFHKQNA